VNRIESNWVFQESHSSNMQRLTTKQNAEFTEDG